MLNLDPGVIIWTWITFFIVLIMLSKLALKPILESIKNRENSIRDDIDSARKQREDAEALLQKHKQLIADADADAKKVIREAQDLAQKSKNDIVESAREEASILIQKAKMEINKQRDDAIQALKVEVVDLAIGAAEKILVQTLDRDAQKKVVDDYIASIPENLKN